MEVVMVEPGKEARLAEIGADLKSLQAAVGGYIEAAYTPAADSEPENDGGFNAAAILPIVLILLLIAGAAAVFLKFRQKKPDTSGATDLDDYEFPEDDEEDEAK